MRTLVLGGARSGKSVFAEELYADEDVCYVATARPWPGDTDFSQRIAEHVKRRPTHWTTEDRIDAATVLANPPCRTVLVDDLGTWLTHTLDDAQAWDAPRGTITPQVQRLIAAVDSFPVSNNLILVSPEVGMGVIPEHRSGRLFRDEIGALNGTLAALCERVTLVVAGIPLTLKP